MRYRYAPLAILLAMLLVTPAFAFWHPGVPSCSTGVARFGVTINGQFTGSAHPYRYNFTEPADNYCDNVTVEVWILNVTDLYGYEFELWWDQNYFDLVKWTVETTWPSQFVVKPTAAYLSSEPYQQVVAAVAPSTGISGDFKLATLIFHIVNDVCWLQRDVDGYFELYALKASDSCSQEIDLCSPLHGYWTFKPKKPKIYIDPAIEVNSKVGEKFTVTVWIENIVKLHDVYVVVRWNGFFHTEEGGFWTSLLKTKKTDVVVNDEVFPVLNRTTDVLNVLSFACGRYQTNPAGYVELYIVMNNPPATPLINGTFWLMKITFTKCDPWYCGAQPDYTPRLEHDWDCENATTDITLEGYFSVDCLLTTGYEYMYIGTDVTVKHGKFVFDPIPGDLDGSGHVDLTDIVIIAGLYGLTWPPADAPYWDYYYDLNKDGIIDVYDIVIVAKNFCRTAP